MTNEQIETTRRKTKTATVCQSSSLSSSSSKLPISDTDPIEILYKIKYEIDSIYRQIQLHRNILCLIDKSRGKQQQQLDDYRCWRRKLLKLKREQCGKRSYEYLYDLYRYLLSTATITTTISDNWEVTNHKSMGTKSLNSVDSHPMLATNRRSTRRKKIVETDTSTIFSKKIKQKPKRKRIAPGDGDEKRSKTTKDLTRNRKSLMKCKFEDCKFVAKTIRSLKSHQKIHAYGKEGLYQCKLCNSTKKFMKQISLDNHLKLSHGSSNVVYPCNIDRCEESFSSWELVRKHKIEVHEQRTVYECDLCHRVYKTKSSLLTHQRDHDSLVCSVEGCSKIFATKIALQHHKRNEHSPPKFRCEKCSKTFRGKAQYTRHQKVLDCTWMYRCHVENCKEEYRQLKQLTEHTQTVHQCEPCFPCSWIDCKYRSHSLHLLNNHYRTHTGERPYPCSWPGCDWRFKTMWLLRTHRKIHLDERNYHCYWPDCVHRSNTAPSFRRHILVHEKNERKRLLKLQLLNEMNEGSTTTTSTSITTTTTNQPDETMPTEVQEEVTIITTIL